MAAYFEHTAFTGFGKWMELQSSEELGHANRFFKYIVERGGKVTLEAIPEPKCDYKSPLEVFKASLGHEQKVSAAICAIYELAADGEGLCHAVLPQVVPRRAGRRGEERRRRSWPSWSWLATTAAAFIKLTSKPGGGPGRRRIELALRPRLPAPPAAALRPAAYALPDFRHRRGGALPAPEPRRPRPAG